MGSALTSDDAKVGKDGDVEMANGSSAPKNDGEGKPNWVAHLFLSPHLVDHSFVHPHLGTCLVSEASDVNKGENGAAAKDVTQENGETIVVLFVSLPFGC